MNSRKKSILIYLGGIITGIILTFAFFFFVALGNKTEHHLTIIS